MRTIIRCPSCFTYVYQDARACHGCGERLGKRKILRRGSWIFIGLAVSAFTIARGIDLTQEKQWRWHREVDRAERHRVAEAFVRSWLTGETDPVSSYACDRESYHLDLARLRDRYPAVLPATRVVGRVQITDESDQQAHYQSDRGKNTVSHVRWGATDRTEARRVSCAPTNKSFGSFRQTVDGVKVRYSSWYLNTVDFEAEFVKGDAHYTIYGVLCLDDDANKVCCLTIDKIQGVEGLISPRN